MNKEDINKIHELIKSDDPNNKLLGFTIGRQIGLSDLELLELTKDGGLMYQSDVGKCCYEFLNINIYSIWFYYGTNKIHIYENSKQCWNIEQVNNDNKLKAFSYFLNLII